MRLLIAISFMTLVLSLEQPILNSSENLSCSLNRDDSTDTFSSDSANLIYEWAELMNRRDDQVGATAGFENALILYENGNALATPKGIQVLSMVAQRRCGRRDETAFELLEAISNHIFAAEPTEQINLTESIPDMFKLVTSVATLMDTNDDNPREVRAYEIGVKLLEPNGEGRSRRGASLHLMLGVALAKNIDVKPTTILQHYELSKSIYAEIGDNRTHEFAALVRNIGLVKANQGDKASFKKALKESLAVAEVIDPPDHGMLLTFLFDLAEQEEDSGIAEEGARYFDRAVKLADEQRLDFNDQNLQSLQNVGFHRQRRKSYTSALAAYNVLVKHHQNKGTTKNQQCQDVYKAIAQIKQMMAEHGSNSQPATFTTSYVDFDSDAPPPRLQFPRKKPRRSQHSPFAQSEYLQNIVS